MLLVTRIKIYDKHWTIYYINKAFVNCRYCNFDCVCWYCRYISVIICGVLWGSWGEPAVSLGRQSIASFPVKEPLLHSSAAEGRFVSVLRIGNVNVVIISMPLLLGTEHTDTHTERERERERETSTNRGKRGRYYLYQPSSAILLFALLCIFHNCPPLQRHFRLMPQLCSVCLLGFNDLQP